MKLILFLTVLLVIGLANGFPQKAHKSALRRPGAHIVGGIAVNITAYPHQLSLRDRGSHICGASIIHSLWAVTASHCVEGSKAAELTVRAGSTSNTKGGTILNVTQIIMHASYDSITLDYDIALLKMSKAFNYSNTIQKIELPVPNASVAAGTNSTVSGWGTTSAGGTSPTNLRAVSVPVVSRTNCSIAYPGEITARMICAGISGKDSCQVLGLANGFPQGALRHPGAHIVGGIAVNITAHPYQLSLRVKGTHVCGASIIHTLWALTASHCVAGWRAADLTVRAGSTSNINGGTIFNVTQIIMHASYNPLTYDYDIALLKMSKAFNYTNQIQKIALPVANATVAAGVNSTVSGWGSTSAGGPAPFNLRAVSVPVISKSSCSIIYPGAITARMMCAGILGKDACQGDSGGPLIALVNNARKLIGVVSWGIGCAKYPGVYCDVGLLVNWIKNKTGNAV